MKIIVLQEDIEQGKQGEYDKCPIALAVNREFHREDAFVSRTYIRLVGEEYCLYFDLPDSATSFIDCFDNSLDVHPFEFEARAC